MDNNNVDKNTFEELVKSGLEFYKAADIKLSPNAFEIDEAKLAASCSVIPTLFNYVGSRIAYGGAMFASVKPGTHLAQVAGESGSLWGALLNDTDNKVSGLAKLSTARPKGLDIASAVFAVLSYATGQYYMNLNAKKMSSVNGTLHSIYDHIEAENSSELMKVNDALKTIIEDYQFIILDVDRLNTTRNSVAEILKESLKYIEYFKNELNSLKERFPKGDDELTVPKKMAAVTACANKLLLSCYNYGLANVVDMALFRVANQDELALRRERVRVKHAESVLLIDETYESMRGFMKTKEFKKMLKKENNNVPAKAAILLVVPAPANFAVDKVATDKKIEGIAKELKKNLSDAETALIDTRCKVTPIPMIDNYIEIQNKKPLLVSKDQKYYIDFVNESDVNGYDKVNAINE